MDDYVQPDGVLGVAFSADRRRAGEQSWIAEAAVEAGQLTLVDCQPLTGRFDVNRTRRDALPRLTKFLGSVSGDCVVGLDFPFALPDEVVAADTWPEFLRELPSWADDPLDLARESEARASLDGSATELVRDTENSLGALSPYNERLRAETFYGIRDILRPLVLADSARALPMQELSPEHPSLLEVYPAGTLERMEGEHMRYTDATAEARERRGENVAVLQNRGFDFADGLRETVIESGDALDAVVAAVSAFEHTRDPSDLQTTDGGRRLEGHIYV
jgi:hypothetical protein